VLDGVPAGTYRDFGGSILRLRDDKARCLIDMSGAIGARLVGLNLDGGKLG